MFFPQNYGKIILIITLVSFSCSKKQGSDSHDSSSSLPALDSAFDVGDMTGDIPDAFAPLPETQKPNPLSLGQILRRECGLENPEDTQAVILDQVMVNPYQRVIESGLLDVFINIYTSIEMLNTQAKSIFTITPVVQKVSANYTLYDKEEVEDHLGLVMIQAESEVALFTGTTTYFAAPRIPDAWSDIICTVAFAETATTSVGGYNTKMRFDPPLPTGVSPNPIANRFEQEIGRYRHFPNIKAEIIETDNPRLQVGDIITGSVFIERIPHSRDIIDTPMDELRGDIAFRVTNTFRDRQTTADLGMLLWSEVYIEHETKQYRHFASDLGTDLQYLYRVEDEGEYPELEPNEEGLQP